MNRLNKALAVLILVFAATGCTPADQEYCDKFGVGGTAEYNKCLGYYSQQQARFSADRAVCEGEADETYPRSLYDRGGYTRMHGGFGYGHGHYYPSTTVFVEPNYYHNAEVDRLRMRVIEPCMQARGWNSGRTWEAGRHSGKKSPRSNAGGGNALPWLK